MYEVQVLLERHFHFQLFLFGGTITFYKGKPFCELHLSKEEEKHNDCFLNKLIWFS